MESTNVLLLLLGLLFTFFIPGFLVIETFYRKLDIVYKIPLYLLLSVLISTYSVYFAGQAFGYNRFTILLYFVPFAVWLLLLKGEIIRRRFDLKKHLGLIISAGLVYFLFFMALYPGVFLKFKDYYVMAGVNWQDTAMHLGIIESISVGNFPPQAPYYSGAPLAYYYFSDFHTAILQTLYGSFMPRILVVDNPFFAAIFWLSMYALAFYITKNRFTSTLSAFLGLFSANMMFLRFFGDLIKTYQVEKGLIGAVISLVTNNAYTMEYGKLIQMPPMVDYFLQNRPMMVGLPSVVMVALLLLVGLKRGESDKLILAGLITGMLIKFQAFAFGVCIILFVSGFLLFGLRRDLRRIFTTSTSFFVPIVGFSLLFIGNLIGGQSLTQMVIGSFQWGLWERGKDLWWLLQFYITNFNLPFLLMIFFGALLIWKRFVFQREAAFLYIWASMMFLAPHLLRFTIFGGDMLKFFYFMLIPMAIISAVVLWKAWKYKLGKSVVVVILIVSSLSSVLPLVNSMLNKSAAYSADEFDVGIWIRERTPVNSVFLTYPSVHSPVSEIGGRLRVLSYINWPYSHGFNTGKDNVFSRLADIEKIYKNNLSQLEFEAIMRKYKVDYLYYGTEEKANYPQAEAVLLKSTRFIPVYKGKGVVIYKYRGGGSEWKV